MQIVLQYCAFRGASSVWGTLDNEGPQCKQPNSQSDIVIRLEIPRCLHWRSLIIRRACRPKQATTSQLFGSLLGR